MKKCKKPVSILLTILMMLSCISVITISAYAEDPIYPEIINYTGSVDGLDIDGDPINYGDSTTIEVTEPMYFDINFYVLNSEQTSGMFMKALDYEIRILPWTNYVSSNTPNGNGEYERMLVYVPQDLIESNNGTYELDMFIRAVKYPNVPLNQLGQTTHLSVTGYKLLHSTVDVCPKCGEIKPDKNGDYLCDKCGEFFADAATAACYFVCPKCGENDADKDGDFLCDKCGETVHTHEYIDGVCLCGAEEPADPEGYSIFVYYDGLSDETASYGSISHDMITEPYYVIPENPDTVKEDLNFNGFYCKNTNQMVQIGDSVPLSDFIEKEDGYYLYLSARFSEKEKPGVTYTDISSYYVAVNVQYPDDPYAYLEDSDAGMLTFDDEFEKLDGQNVGTVTQPKQVLLYVRMGLNFMGYRSLLTGNVFETGDTIDVDKLPEAVYVGYELQEINEEEGYRISLYEVNDYVEPMFEYLGAVGGFLEPMYECTVNYYIPVEPDENEGTTGDPLQFYSFAGSDVHTLAMFDLDMPMELTCQPDYMEDLGYVFDGYGALDDDEITYPDGLIFMDQYSTNDDAGHLTYDVKLFYTKADEDATEEELLAAAKEKISAKYQDILDDASASEGVKTVAAAILADIENAADRSEMMVICRNGEELLKLQEAKDMAIAEVMAIAPEGDITDEMQAVIDQAAAAIQASDNADVFEDIISEARSEINRLMREEENSASGAVQDVQYTPAVGTNNSYQIKVEDRANMVQLIELDHGTGTRSFDRYNDNVTIVSYDRDGNVVSGTSKDLAYEVWTITTTLADGNIGVRVKEAGSSVWEDASDAYEFENTYAPVDSGIISATLAKTEGSKGAVKATVIAGAETKIVQLKNKEGETFTFNLSKATENEDGTLTFNCSVYFHGTAGTENIATVRYNDAYGWYDTDVTVEYTIK